MCIDDQEDQMTAESHFVGKGTKVVFHVTTINTVCPPISRQDVLKHF